jgi:hypothetical protein
MMDEHRDIAILATMTLPTTGDIRWLAVTPGGSQWGLYDPVARRWLSMDPMNGKGGALLHETLREWDGLLTNPGRAMARELSSVEA